MGAVLLSACATTIGGTALRHQSSGLQYVLPTADEVEQAVGNPLDPTGPPVVGAISLLPNGIRDSADVSPLECLGAATPLMRVVYEQGDVRGVGLRDFTRYGEGQTVSSVHTGVVRFASDVEAARMFSTFVTRWLSCDNTAVVVNITADSTLQWTVTDVRQSGVILSATVLSGDTGGESDFPTEHAIGVAADCIVDVDVAITDVLPARRVATTRAVDLVEQMLDNIRRGA